MYDKGAIEQYKLQIFNCLFQISTKYYIIHTVFTEFPSFVYLVKINIPIISGQLSHYNKDIY